ncbi:Chromatin modification-related protein eaf3 [Colletotrichum sp. SAR 10_76]|nr:Chromatin modification-related protein eaf3 [Colletotrichum sp. SAR 10_76]
MATGTTGKRRTRKPRPADATRRRARDFKNTSWKEPRLAADYLCQPAPRTKTYVTKDGRTNFDGRYALKPKPRKREQPVRQKRGANSPSDKPKEEVSPEHDDLATPRLPETEDSFHARPSIKLPIPDHIKAMLVDDWENITKNNQLVPLPHPHPVDEILNDYLAFEKPNREDGSANMDILEEVLAGLREYFEKSLSRILLYRFERPQYHEIRKEWEKAGENDKNKSVCDTYGSEHLCRLMVSLPELVAQTNMDSQSVGRLREELSKFTVWLGKHAKNYFVSEYETPSQEYIDKARGF